MGWDSRPTYPPDAIYTVSLKATSSQRARWEGAAKRQGLSRGAFLAWAADMAVALREAYLKVTEDHDRALHPERYR